MSRLITNECLKSVIETDHVPKFVLTRSKNPFDPLLLYVSSSTRTTTGMSNVRTFKVKTFHFFLQRTLNYKIKKTNKIATRLNEVKKFNTVSNIENHSTINQQTKSISIHG